MPRLETFRLPGHDGPARCRACGKPVDPDDSRDLLEEDFDGHAFRLEAHAMPCCGAWLRLVDLFVAESDGPRAVHPSPEPVPPASSGSARSSPAESSSTRR